MPLLRVLLLLLLSPVAESLLVPASPAAGAVAPFLQAALWAVGSTQAEAAAAAAALEAHVQCIAHVLAAAEEAEADAASPGPIPSLLLRCRCLLVACVLRVYVHRKYAQEVETLARLALGAFCGEKNPLLLRYFDVSAGGLVAVAALLPRAAQPTKANLASILNWH